MKISFIIAIVALVALTRSSALAQAPASAAPIVTIYPAQLELRSDVIVHAAAVAKPTAQRALVQLSSFAATRYALLGFHSPAEFSSAQLGNAIPLYYVPLDRLKAFTEGGDPRSLLYGGNELLYPLMVGSTTRSSITVAYLNGAWRTTVLGRPKMITQLTSARTDDMMKWKAAVTSYFEVSVPALNLRFLGRIAGGQLYLIPVATIPGTPLRADTPYLAQSVFLALVPLARANNGQPT